MLDYCKGIFDNPIFVQKLIQLGRKKNIPLYIDSRSNDLSKFNGANVLKLNLKEFEEALKNNELMKLNIDKLIVTMGKDGAEICDLKDNNLIHLYSYSPNTEKLQGVPDVTGCGDVFDVTFCWYWCIKEFGVIEALREAVKKATEFAYKPIKERLTC